MSILQQLSGVLVEATQNASQFVVSVSGGTRFGASGVIWQTGSIVTTRSTIRRDDNLRVTLPTGDTLPAALAGHDAGTDIAVLTFQAPAETSRPPVAASAEPGELVLAIGRASNTGVNAALGLVSAVSQGWQTWQGGKIDRYLRLDLTLYPGGSGAAVVNTSGELLGIVSGALSRIAPLAIPAATVDRVAAQLLAEGRVKRPWLGVGVQPVPLAGTLSEAAKSLTHGLLILAAEAETPAGRAGLLVGDILLSLDNTPVRDPMDLRHFLAGRNPGDKIRIGLLRGGERKELDVELGERDRRH
jgi:S1-C subfamily serine protease